MLAAPGRHRRLVIVVTAAVLALAVWRIEPLLLRVLLSLAALTAWVLALVAWARPKPARFVVDTRRSAFRTGPALGQVYGSVATMTMAATLVLPLVPFGSLGNMSPAEDLLFHTMAVGYGVLCVLLALLVLVNVTALWRGTGLELRPDGLTDRTPFGVLVVPWDALAPGHPVPVPPRAPNIMLTYARPELVRRRGLVVARRIVQAGGTDAAFLAYAIRCYVEDPGRRPAIGTDAEHAALLGATVGSASRPAR